MNRIQSARIRNRSGAILICVLVCMSVVTTMTMIALQASLRHRRQMNTHWRLEQTRWLLDAGLSRAISKLQTNPDYEGETWSLDRALVRHEVARVTIGVSQDKENPDFRIVRLRAEIDPNSPVVSNTKRSRTWIVNLSE